MCARVCVCCEEICCYPHLSDKRTCAKHTHMYSHMFTNAHMVSSSVVALPLRLLPLTASVRSCGFLTAALKNKQDWSICGCLEPCATSDLRLGGEAPGSGVGFNTCAEIRATCAAAGPRLRTQQTDRGRALTLPGTTAEHRSLGPDLLPCRESFSLNPKIQMLIEILLNVR